MHTRLRELSDLLASERAALLAAVETVPAELRERRPADGEWTVAEVLDHLRAVEAGSAGLLARRAQRAREAGVGADPETTSVLGRIDHLQVADSPAPRVAPEIVRPRADATAAEALDALAESRTALLATVAQLDGVDGAQVKAMHAALGELDAYQWLLFLAEHERRHARQIARLGERLRNG